MFSAQDLNDDGNSTLVLDPSTEDCLAQIAQSVYDVEQDILSLDNQIDRNRVERKPNKLNKPLRKKKKHLTIQKNTLEKK
jgi:hypothetical protein